MMFLELCQGQSQALHNAVSRGSLASVEGTAASSAHKQITTCNRATNKIIPGGAMYNNLQSFWQILSCAKQHMGDRHDHVVSALQDFENRSIILECFTGGRIRQHR